LHNILFVGDTKMNPIKKVVSTGLTWLWITVLVIMIDRFTKIWVTDHLIAYEPLKLHAMFNLTLAYNTGAAFSFLHTAAGWQNILLLSIALIVSVIICYWLYQSSVRERWMNIALCFILGGALGNAWDRIAYGYVIDFFDFHLGAWHFAIFNVADSAISLGAFMLFWHWARK
jgi:signal peptidase II